MTYSSITRVQSNILTQTKSTYYSIPQMTNEEVLKINICVAHVHYKNLENPGNYSVELNKMLTVNNLPNIIIPDCLNTDNILTEATQQETQAQTSVKGSVTLPPTKKRESLKDKQKRE